MTTTATASATRWDEPAGCSSPRGWFYAGELVTGFYLAYGPDSYRPGHVSDIGGGRTASLCRPGRLCRECEPGHILACRYPAGPGTAAESRYCETVAEARAYVEAGMAAYYERLGATSEQAARWAEPIPDTTFYRPMRAGHRTRTGHELTGQLVSDDGAIWHLERTCCG